MSIVALHRFKSFSVSTSFFFDQNVPLFRTVALLFDQVDSRQEEPLSRCIRPGGFTTGRVLGCDGPKRPVFVGVMGALPI